MASAAQQNPELLARVGENEDGTAKTQALAIGQLDIDVVISGDTARTRMTASFVNTGKDILEGQFSFALPAGAIVTGYALDIEDRMVDGVLAAPRRARLAYEASVRRGIDPGLAEVTRANLFTNRVYPILPGKGRSIRLEFVTPVDAETPFSIPLATEQPVGGLSIRVRAAGVTREPRLTAPRGIALHWVQGPDGYVASGRLTNRPLAGALSAGPLDHAAFRLSRHGNGEAFFEIHDLFPVETQASRPRRLRIYWDSSRSRREQDHDAELDIVARYVAAVQPRIVDLVLFADADPVVKTLRVPRGQDVGAALQDAVYEGATSLSPLRKNDLPAADTCLLFSDGNITVDPYRPARLSCPLHAISTAKDANRGFLGALARRSGGEFIDMTTQTPATALARLIRAEPRVVDVTGPDGRSVDHVTLTTNGPRIRVVGKLPERGDLMVKLTNGARSYAVKREEMTRSDDAGALWAARRIEEMNATDRPDNDRMLALSRRYSVAGVAATFVVFENISDYLDADVPPPPVIGKTKQYRDALAAATREKERANRERLDKIVAMWNGAKAWWARKFDPVPVKPKVVPQGERPLSRPAPAPPPPAAPASSAQSETVTVSSSRLSVEQRPNIVLTIAPWNPKRPYLAALDAAAADTFWAVYRDQERTHGGMPAFYLDVAEYLFRHGQARYAIRILLNALDLRSCDTATLTIAADRLMRYGDEARAIWLYERIAFLEPDRPQPIRNLALGLASRADRMLKQGGHTATVRADYARAVQLLNDIVMHDWSSRFDGIEMIALMEANRIIPRLHQAGGEISPLDARLVALLDVDLRVVLEWNTDETDMDLWVDEPSGEHAMYSNANTGIGGHLSNDMTNGYGPEEYLLHRAPAGTYTVRANVFATDRINPNGATMIRAHVFRDYGRPNEESQMLELELARGDKDKDMALVGTITVAPRP